MFCSVFLGCVMKQNVRAVHFGGNSVFRNALQPCLYKTSGSALSWATTTTECEHYPTHKSNRYSDPTKHIGRVIGLRAKSLKLGAALHNLYFNWLNLA
jgi:hypothetical protein